MYGYPKLLVFGSRTGRNSQAQIIKLVLHLQALLFGTNSVFGVDESDSDRKKVGWVESS